MKNEEKHNFKFEYMMRDEFVTGLGLNIPDPNT